MYVIWMFVMRELDSLIPIKFTWKNKEYKYIEINNVHIFFFFDFIEYLGTKILFV